MLQTMDQITLPARDGGEHKGDSEHGIGGSWRRRLRVGITLLALAPPVGAAAVPFGPRQSISIQQDGPEALAVGDVDRDGDPDLLVASSVDHELVWFANDGAGGFSVQQTLGGSVVTPGGTPVVLADLDGDGDLDVLHRHATLPWVVRWEYDSALDRYNTNGLTAVFFETLADRALVAGDVDGDGKVDLYAADEKTFFSRGNGHGSFQPPVEVLVAAGSWPVSHLELADVDGDGDLDLVASLPAISRVIWAINDGSGALLATVSVGTIDQPGSLATADVDGDGDLDIVAPDPGGNAVVWFENTGVPTTPTWPVHTIDTSAPGARAAAAADLDHDGDLDVVAAWESGDAVVWYENANGTGTLWTEHPVDELADGARVAEPLDVDSDGDLDLVALLFDGDEVVWYENLTIHRSAGAFVPHLMTSANSLAGLSTGDVDGDGDVDALLNGSGTANNLHWLENDGSPASGPWTRHLIGSAFFPTSIRAADIDGDSDLDALVVDSNNEVRWLEQGSSPVSGPWSSHLIDSGTALFPVTVIGADVDRDGDLDVITVSIDDEEINWFENDGSPASGTWTAHLIDVGTLANSRGIDVGDLDRDGDLDVLGSSLNNKSLYWFENDGAPASGTWASHLIAFNDSAFPSSVAAADLDADGDLDALARWGSGILRWFENDGTPGDGAWTEHPLATLDNPAAPVVTDFDADGDLDVVTASSTEDRVYWLENDDTPADGPWAAHVIDTGAADHPLQVAVVDVDGDGDLDALASSGSGAVGEVHWFENRGGQFALATEVTAPSFLIEGARDDLLRSTMRHLGRAGDGDEELASVALRLRHGSGEPMSPTAAGSILTSLSVWQDSDASGSFDADTDLELATLTDFSAILKNGVLGLPLADDDPQASVPFGAPLPFFVVVETTGDASAHAIGGLEVTLLSSDQLGGPTTAEDRDHDLPLVLEPGVDAVVVVDLSLFADGFETGDTSAWSSTLP